MSLCALGFAEEFREAGIASNALWPRTLIATAAVQNLLGGDAAMARARSPELYADAAYAILTRPSRECTGNTYLCEDVLAEEGVTDLSPVRLRRGRRPAGRPLRRPRVTERQRMLTRTGVSFGPIEPVPLCLYRSTSPLVSHLAERRDEGVCPLRVAERTSAGTPPNPRRGCARSGALRRDCALWSNGANQPASGALVAAA